MTELNVTAVASKDAGVNLSGVTSERWKPSSFFWLLQLDPNMFQKLQVQLFNSNLYFLQAKTLESWNSNAPYPIVTLFSCLPPINRAPNPPLFSLSRRPGQ